MRPLLPVKFDDDACLIDSNGNYVDGRLIIRAVNNYDRLREALDRLVRSCDNLEYEAGRVALPASDAEDLLAELDNLENDHE